MKGQRGRGGGWVWKTGLGMNGWRNVHNGMRLAFKEKGILQYVMTRMNRESVTQVKQDIHRKTWHGSTYMTYQNNQTHRHKEENGGCRGLGGGGDAGLLFDGYGASVMRDG